VNKKQKLAVIDAILKLNAALIGERQNVFVSVSMAGKVRIGTRKRGEARYYPSVDVALAKAWESLKNAEAASLRMFGPE
jgi:hypothetical protein